MRRLLAGAETFMEANLPAEPDVAYFHRLRRIRLTRDNAYPMLRRAGRLLGAVEAELTNEKLHTVRGSILRSEEHTSELQSQSNLVCRLLLETKKNSNSKYIHVT